jgi:N,N-dimethylformamidase
MDIVGYSDRLTVRQGESVGFMVSSQGRYRSSLIRLIHGDTSHDGPGFRCEEVPSELDGERNGHVQRLRTGSFVEVPDSPVLRGADGLGLVMHVMSTFIGSTPQGLVGRFDCSRQLGWAVVLDRELGVGLWLGQIQDRTARFYAESPLRPWTWYRVEVVWDTASGSVQLTQAAVDGSHERQSAQRAPATRDTMTVDRSLLIAALWDGDLTTAHFNGKIDNPTLRASDGELIASWDFSLGIGSSSIEDVSGNGHHGRAVNRPMRAATGAAWKGREVDWRSATSEYSAIHFHEDDLIDAGWEESFRLETPEDLRPGYYAVRLSTATDEDHLPFVVVPGNRSRRAKIAVLAPTYSYLAYANNHFSYLLYNEGEHVRIADALPTSLAANLGKEDLHTIELGLLSLYDRHADGSGSCFASSRRPLLNMRPTYRHARSGAPHQLGADLHLIAWLEARGFDYDVITDSELHRKGLPLLQEYRVVLTGSHPEYWSCAMLDAIEGYPSGAGRLMYLGGNGFYWVIAVDPDEPEVIEVRRGLRGTGTWRSEVGEGHHEISGEPGGLWRDRGRAPQRLVGVGMASESFDPARPYERTRESFVERVRFIFDGVRDDARIGEHGLVLGAAAGFEIDRADETLGTPPHALVVATASGFSNGYQPVIEEVAKLSPSALSQAARHVHADMVYFETPGGGAVFSTGSIAWCGALPSNGFDNDVARITENVLRRFASEEPFAMPRS